MCQEAQDILRIQVCTIGTAVRHQGRMSNDKKPFTDDSRQTGNSQIVNGDLLIQELFDCSWDLSYFIYDTCMLYPPSQQLGKKIV